MMLKNCFGSLSLGCSKTGQELKLLVSELKLQMLKIKFKLQMLKS